MSLAVWFVVVVSGVFGHGSRERYYNSSFNNLDPSRIQLGEFRMRHPRPIGVLTTSAGKPVEVREAFTHNSDVFNNAFFLDMQTSGDHERIPERIVHAKGTGAFGYFQVTNDVSKYTKANVFNGIGKKTPVVTRFSIGDPKSGGRDLERDILSIVVKFYTNEGNLDLLTFHIPLFTYRDPIDFIKPFRAFRRNPKTNILDQNQIFDFPAQSPDTIHIMLWVFSDIGIPNGYRKVDYFPVQTFEVTNKHGESYFVRFSFRTEQGVEFLTTEEATVLRSLDPDYSIRDLYNAIAEGNYPSWIMEMDVMPKDRLQTLNFNPFDVTRLWENGTFHTVPIGRLVLNRNPENFFKDVEMAAYNPGNLVPGIPGPRDTMFKARRMAYRDAQNYRLGSNHNNIEVNRPKNVKSYNRDGKPPTLNNMKDVPNYQPNSFNGPVPYVDAERFEQGMLIWDRVAVDLQPPADFYNTFVTTEDHRDRMTANIAGFLVECMEPVQRRFIKMLTLIDWDLGTRTKRALAKATVEWNKLQRAQKAFRPMLSINSTLHRNEHSFRNLLRYLGDKENASES